MNLFLDRHQRLLELMLTHQVKFIVIGGYSVVFHGYTRTTGDIDIWVKPDNSNRERLIRALRDLDIREESLSDLSRLDFTRHLAFQMWEEPEKVDFLTYIQGVTYEEADKEKIVALVDQLSIPFIHLNHLVLSKLMTGRLQDQADIEELQKITRDRKE